MARKSSAGRSAEQVHRDWGGFEKWKGICRHVGRWSILEELARDLLLALRLLRKSPVFTAVALVTLTLAMGANTAVFSLLNELMLKSVPVPNAPRLALLRIQPDQGGYTFSYPLFQAVEQQAGAVMRVFAWSDRSFNLRTSDGVEAVPGEFVSGLYFAALGVKPYRGRCLEPRDDRPAAPDGMVAVVSHHFWQNRMGSRGRALGQKITLNQGVFTVVGILPQSFRGMSRDRAPEVFLPLSLEPFVDSPFNLISAGYRAWWLSVGSLLDEGVSLEQANAFLRTNSRHFFAAVPPALTLGPKGHKLTDLHVMAEPGANGFSSLRLRFRQPVRVLMGLVALVLLIACLNLATLFTARAATRVREMATRFALGASRARLVRQLLTESLLLALMGASLGLATAPALAHFLAAMLIPQRGPQVAPLEVRPDLTVFAFTALLAFITTVLAGTLPAVRSTQGDVPVAMKEGSDSMRGAERRRWWPRLFLALEVALSLVLATGASLLGYSLVKLYHAPLGFKPGGLVFLVPEGKQPILDQRLLWAYQQAVEEIQSLPPVEDVSLSAGVPLQGGYLDEDLQAMGGAKYHLQENSVGPHYFKTLGTPLLSGREFRWTDREGSGRKVILNRAAARLLFPEGQILGQHVSFSDGKTQAEVVGVVEDSKYTNLREMALPTVYSTAMQGLIPGASLDIVIRTKGPVTPVIVAARNIAKRVIPDVPLPTAMRMEERIAESLAAERIMATLALFFGGLSLLITGIGLYGTLAYSTERRTGEMGIRLALGAKRRHILATVCAENGLITVFGCFAGMAGSILASKTIASLLYGVSAHDPAVLGATAGLLLCVAVAASLLPAIKAARMDPLAAIRYE